VTRRFARLARECARPTRAQWYAGVAVLALTALVAVLQARHATFLTGPFWSVVIPAGITLGLVCPRWTGLGLLVLLLVPLEFAQGYLNPGVAVIALGLWFVAQLFRDHRRLVDGLRIRAAELAAEREVFAVESVRYERTRIARELHDVIGHCLSVVVLQAAAGERLATRSPVLAAQALDDIGRVAHEARVEVAHLVHLLTPVPPAGSSAVTSLVSELVNTAASAGLDVRCRVHGSFDRVPDEVAQVAYRVVQEGLTNAFRHAPGAAVTVEISGSSAAIDVDITNDAQTATTPHQLGSGDGRGLAGMQSRVEEVGGRLTAGGLPTGGWRVRARLPIRPPAAHRLASAYRRW
jgi:signal transduction histidine kinase